MSLTAGGVKLNLCEVRNEMNCQHRKQFRMSSCREEVLPDLTIILSGLIQGVHPNQGSQRVIMTNGYRSSLQLENNKEYKSKL